MYSATGRITPLTSKTTDRSTTVFTDSYNRASPGSNYSVTAPDVTFSQNSTFLRSARATTGSFVNYMRYLAWPYSSQGFTSENWTMTLRFRVVTSSVGICVGAKSISGSTNVDLLGAIVTGASGYTTQYHNGVEKTPRSSTFATANGDRLDLIVNFNINVLTVTCNKLDGSGNIIDSTSSSFTLDPTSSSVLSPTLSQPTIYFMGGTYDLESFSMVEGRQYTDILFVGDSITKFYHTSTIPNRWVNKVMEGSSKSYTVCASPGAFTREIVNNILEITQLLPEYVVLEVGTNDIGGSVTSTIWQSNHTTVTNALLAAGIKPVILYCVPRNTFDYRPSTSGSINHWKNAQYGSDPRFIVVDVYTALKDPIGNGINPAYSADGIHLNDAGGLLKANTIRSAIPTIIGI